LKQVDKQVGGSQVEVSLVVVVLGIRVIHVSGKDNAGAVDQHVKFGLEVLHIDSLLVRIDGGLCVF
jgi:hypothetical protein